VTLRLQMAQFPVYDLFSFLNVSGDMDNFATQTAWFKALAHPVRLQILSLLRYGGEVCVCHMEAALNRRQAYISQQLMILREAGLIDSRRDGRMVFYWIAEDRLPVLLGAAFGSLEARRLPPIDGCNCPSCTTVPIDRIEVRP
jgi:DNA-binding transcriptional ArsR family regulator